MKNQATFTSRLATFAASQRYFRIIVGVLLLEASWIALSGRYPMAFDEDFHLGIIRIYAHHLNPFLQSQPDGANQFGAIARDPSYLYHYLLSFPYRLISALTGNQTAQVTLLRFINIGLFASSLPLIRRLLRKTEVSDAVINVCLSVFVLIPVVPLMAAQINYDNLFVPLTSLALLLTLRIVHVVQKQRRIDIVVAMQLLVLCLLTSLVKYAFLPIFLAIVGYVLVKTKHSLGWRQTIRRVAPEWRILPATQRWLLVGAVLVSAGLFLQRDGVNLVRYHTPVPTCNQVLTIQQCSEYGPWIRDYNYHNAKVASSSSPILFTGHWFYGMWLRLFFAVDGPGTQFESRVPLLVPGIAAMVFFGVGAASLLAYSRQIYARYSKNALVLFMLSAGFYIGALWLDEYRAYLRTGQPVAINGRYLLPLMGPILLLLALGYIELFKRRRQWMPALGVVIIACFLWGGGALTYILRSNDTWYWPNSAVHTANHAVQRSIGPLVPGYYSPTDFPWK